MTAGKTKSFNTISYKVGEWEEGKKNTVNEQPIGLTVNNEPWLTLMCTPNDLEALAVGFLYNEEVIETMDDVASVRVCPDGTNIDLWLNRSVKKPENWTRTTGCSGGETSLVNYFPSVRKTAARDDSWLPAEKVGELIELLSEVQDLYWESGGVHTSALSDGDRIIIAAEDIGRHNTLDKIAGRYIMERISPIKKIILTTGRISSEMIQKSGRIGAEVVISRTAPSSLSVQIADEMGITLIGYARRNRFTIYTHPDRIIKNLMGDELSSEAA
jgi:FdhD protein